MPDQLPSIAQLKRKGCDLPFYYDLQSYQGEFFRTMIQAKKDYPTLLNVHRVNSEAMKPSNILGWLKEYYPDYSPIDLSNTDGSNDLTDEDLTDISGCVSFLNDTHGQWSAVILVNMRPSPTDLTDKQWPYMLASLLHEIGHLDDATKSGTLNPVECWRDPIPSEAYAYCFALDALADRSNYLLYESVYNTMLTASQSNTRVYADACKLVIANHKKRTVTNWKDYL